MRISTIALIAIVCLTSSMVRAQDPATVSLDNPLPSRTVFKLSPQHFAVNSLKAGIERFNADRAASFVVMITGRLEDEDDPFDGTSYDGLAGEFQLRKYISPMKPRISRNGNSFYEGIYGAVYLQGGFYSSSYSDNYTTYDPDTGNPTQVGYNYDMKVRNGGLGFAIGYQKTLWHVVFLEAFIGGGIQFAGHEITGYKPKPVMFDTDGGITDPIYEGILPKIGLNIGIGL